MISIMEKDAFLEQSGIDRQTDRLIDLWALNKNLRAPNDNICSTHKVLPNCFHSHKEERVKTLHQTKSLISVDFSF